MRGILWIGRDKQSTYIRLQRFFKMNFSHRNESVISSLLAELARIVFQAWELFNKFISFINDIRKHWSMNWHNHIISDPAVLFGKPVIKGTRIPVDIILEKIAAGYSFDELLKAYLRITKEDIQACLFFAADNAKHEKVLSVG